MPVKITVILFVIILSSSCRTTERYYIRNFSPADQAVYISGPLSPGDLDSIRIHKENVLNIIEVTDVPYTAKPVIYDSLAYHAVIIPPASVAYMGRKGRDNNSMNHVKFLSATGKDMMWTRQETLSGYIYYVDIK